MQTPVRENVKESHTQNAYSTFGKDVQENKGDFLEGSFKFFEKIYC